MYELYLDVQLLMNKLMFRGNFRPVLNTETHC